MPAPKRKRSSQTQEQPQPRTTRHTRATDSVDRDANESLTSGLAVRPRVVGRAESAATVAPAGRPNGRSIKVTAGSVTGQGGQDSGHVSDRNVDKVVLGDICFRAWYPSCYPNELLGDFAGGSARSEKGGKATPITNGSSTSGMEEVAGAKPHSRRDRDNHHPMLDRLYVCPWCFKYSKELVAWWEHVHLCERHGALPGMKVYSHPKGRRTILLPSEPATKPTRGKKSGAGPKMVERIVEDQGEWSVWEVDGAKDVLFCQNLSLFAKLFLDNKSVFFDVAEFRYFLLVYTPPTPPADPSAEVSEVVEPRGRVVGFFSKEKMSWDNNNLACILIFPPWQRKGLGALLMGISYEISRQEGVIGGPEKPISDLGKMGYKRFWAGEVARWILSQNSGNSPEEAVFDVNDCSEATWIAAEDCLLVLREMGVVQHAEKGPRRTLRPRTEEDGTPEEEDTVERVRIAQDDVRAWVKAQNISLEKTCDPAGFLHDYSTKVHTEAEESG
ncbi:histone acetyltransferase [Rhypophila decipiens]|uniref:histone acetyltransferase n=1 Tax=Rhypophila decipiens TaxID=261697 RepID=A0AAN6YKK9_9PEZI|nr:histone acetyltransferase [Rhypophila decipiens]